MATLIENRQYAYFCVRAEGGSNGLLISVLEVDKRCLETLIDFGDLGHVTECTAIHIVYADDVRIWSKRLEDCRCRGRPRRKGKCLGAPSLDGSQTFLESIAVRVS